MAAPSFPSTLQNIIKSYLYQQYSDDDDLQAFVNAYNDQAQYYLDWFNQTPLPVYTNPNINGVMLDWGIAGLYGIEERPTLPSGGDQDLGTYNTLTFDRLTFNGYQKVFSANVYMTSDDVFRRILTWAFYKGDGKQFNIRWLKRRVTRFLFGVNGVDPGIDNTYQVSVTFSPGNQVNINVLSGVRRVLGGSMWGASAFNTQPFDALVSSYVAYPKATLAPILQSAIEAGVLELPFQFTYVVNI